MCSASHLIVLYICVKNRENILDGIRVIEPIRMTAAQTDGWTNTQNFGGYNTLVRHKNDHFWSFLYITYTFLFG